MIWHFLVFEHLQQFTKLIYAGQHMLYLRQSCPYFVKLQIPIFRIKLFILSLYIFLSNEDNKNILSLSGLGL